MGITLFMKELSELFDNPEEAMRKAREIYAEEMTEKERNKQREIEKDKIKKCLQLKQALESKLDMQVDENQIVLKKFGDGFYGPRLELATITINQIEFVYEHGLTVYGYCNLSGCKTMVQHRKMINSRKDLGEFLVRGPLHNCGEYD